jgi:NAD(P)-dependent dehydrogenase (short-subunit alcohol dehydrogenase family)
VDEAGRAVAASLGERARFRRADVSREDDVAAAVAQAVSAFGSLHGAVNCAGIVPGERVVGKSGPHTLATFERTLGVNLVGTFNVLRLAAAQMARQDPLSTGERGVIVNTSSIAAEEGQIGQVAYAASKAGVNGMTLPAARELAKLGIRVVAIAPGIFDTPMVQGLSDEIRASLGAQVPFPSRLGKPEEYAQLARHAVENTMLNGCVLRIDGAIRMGAR